MDVGTGRKKVGTARLEENPYLPSVGVRQTPVVDSAGEGSPSERTSVPVGVVEIGPRENYLHQVCENVTRGFDVPGFGSEG